MRTVIALLASLLLGAAVIGHEPLPTAPPTVLDNPARFDQATLKVIGAVCEVTVGSGNVRSRGSGTLVGFTADGKAIVLSCRHVCETVGDHVTVKWPQYGETAYGRVSHVITARREITRQDGNWETDLAIILCDKPKGVEPVKVVPFCPDCGPWVAVGWRDSQIRVAFGERASVVNGSIKINSPFVGGQSGGALFDRYGRLVGVTVASTFDYGISSMPQDLLNQR